MLSCKPLAGTNWPDIVTVVLVIVVHIAVVEVHDPGVARIAGNFLLTHLTP